LYIKYALEIIKDSGYVGAKPVEFPMEECKLSNKGEQLKDPAAYRHLVGRLIYLTITKPDITYSMHVLSRFMHEPRQQHMAAALRVVRYLKGAPGQGLLLHSNTTLKLRAFCDSDWAGCPITRRSTTGYCVFLGDSLISWRTKRQKTVSLSSAEAEYRAMAGTCCELTWLRYLLADLHLPVLGLLFYIVITKRLCILLQIRCFMKGPGTLKWIVILLEIKFCKVKLQLNMLCHLNS
jgi:hypothetical protein